MSIKCPKCGVENADEAINCIWCHVKLSAQVCPDVNRGPAVDQKADIQKGEIQDSSAKKKKIFRLITLILIMIVLFTIWLSMNRARVSKSGIPFKRSKQGILSLLRSKIFPKKGLKITRGSNACKINGILYSDDNPFVIINDTIYFSNDSVCGGKIIDISENRITVQHQDKQEVYRVGNIIK